MKLLVDNCRPNCTGTQCPETDSHQQCKTVLVQVNYLLKDNASVPDDEDAAERQCRILHDGRAVEHSKEKAAAAYKGRGGTHRTQSIQPWGCYALKNYLNGLAAPPQLRMVRVGGVALGGVVHI